MDNNTKEKTTQLLAKIILFFLLVAIITFPFWLYTIFGNIALSILVFAVEMVMSLGFIVGSSN